MEDNELDKNDNQKITFSIEGFEGPLDLLLQLVKEKNIEIKDVQLASVTDQYLNYIKDLDYINMEEATEFLNIASMLLEIKSQSLLPVEPISVDGDDQPLSTEEQLKLRLQEYELFKQAGGNLSSGLGGHFIRQSNHITGGCRKTASACSVFQKTKNYGLFQWRNRGHVHRDLRSKTNDLRHPAPQRRLSG